MPLDVTVSPKNVTATLHYLVRGDEKPVRYVDEPPLGVLVNQIAGDQMHVRGETSRVEFKPEHRWYYFSEQQPYEVLLIRVHDSKDDGRARLSFHTSFENPLAQGAPPRESIEVRTLVFFPPGT